MPTENKTWIITGAGRGLGVDIAKAALAAGHNAVATGRNPAAVAEALGDADNLLVAKLDVTPQRGRTRRRRGGCRALRRHRRAGQQRGELLRRLL
jgi:NAD(P)-dependent dehydrogenase (short-subunit alcohol dehydrogenase family)